MFKKDIESVWRTDRRPCRTGNVAGGVLGRGVPAFDAAGASDEAVVRQDDNSIHDIIIVAEDNYW